MRMQKCIEKPYVVESSDSEEDDENDDDIEAGNKEGVDEEEDTDKDEEESATVKGEDFAQGMNSTTRNSPPRMNKHI